MLPISLLLAPAVAESPERTLAHTRQIEKVTAQLAYYTDSLAEACGLTAEVDWDSFIAAKRFDGVASTVASACQGGIQGLTETCGDAAAKGAVTKRIGSVTCVHVSDKKSTGLGLVERQLQIRVHVMDTGATSNPASLMAPTRVDALRWLEKKL